LGIRSFSAGLLFTLSGSLLTAGAVGGTVSGAGVAQWLSVANDTLSQLLATAGPLPPVTLVATDGNWIIESVSWSVTIGSPTLVQN
jgi:hypothetical protein